MKVLKLYHSTRYRFSEPVQLGAHLLRFRPREGPELRIKDAHIEVTPSPRRIRWARDALDNAVATVDFNDALVQELAIINDVTVAKYDLAPLDFTISDYAVDFPFAYQSDDVDILRPFFSNASEADRLAADAWARRVGRSQTPCQTYTLLERLCRAIRDDLTYTSREEPGVQTVQETLAKGSGSCRDFANLFMEAARSHGLAARFVSGYRFEAGLARELGATHAWAEIYLPGAGWKGFDPTIGALTDWSHISTAVARSPENAPPVEGSYFGPPVETTMEVLVDVREL